MKDDDFEERYDDALLRYRRLEPRMERLIATAETVKEIAHYVDEAAVMRMRLKILRDEGYFMEPELRDALFDIVLAQIDLFEVVAPPTPTAQPTTQV